MSSRHLLYCGAKDFHGSVDVTDPCYNKDVWCRLDHLEVADGTFLCIAYTSKHWYPSPEANAEKKRIYYTNVDRIGIYHIGLVGDRIADAHRNTDYIGSIGVDSGLAGFFHDKPDDFNIRKRSDVAKAYGNVFFCDSGFFSTSGYGDGYYDVYGTFESNTKKIIALEIDFADYSKSSEQEA